MGTNFYWHDVPCDHCKRHTELHVCKSQRMWRAYPHKLDNDKHPEWGYNPESPVGFPILSLADWRTVFIERPGNLYDEYGEQVADPIAWLDSAQPWKPGPGQHYLEEDVHRGVGWLDAQGHRFYAGDFS